MTPSLTCVVPTWNSGQTLHFTLASLTTQRDIAATIIVVDGGSTDETLAICDRWSVPVIFEPPGNMYAAIHAGFARASSAWLAWVNSDDLLYPSAWSSLLHCVEREGAHFAYGDADFIDDQGRFLSSYDAAPPHALLSIFRHRIMAFAQPTVIFSARAYADLAGFDRRYCLGADADLFIRALQKGFRFSRLSGGPIAAFRIHAQQQSNTKRSMFSIELDQIYAQVGEITMRDRIEYLRWRLRNVPNYAVRALRSALLGRGVRIPTFDSQR